MSCTICEKRLPKRFCPAKGEKICAVCCGREREITIDCPADCTHLLAGRRYEAEHREPVKPEEYPYADLRFSVDLVYERWPLVSSLGLLIVTFASQHKELNDADIYSVLDHLAETYRALGTGIYYERVPEIPLRQALYRELARYLTDSRQGGNGMQGGAVSTDADIFKLLVFLLRMNKMETSGRPRSRSFLEFLRSRFPLPANKTAPTSSRIIIP